MLAGFPIAGAPIAGLVLAAGGVTPVTGSKPTGLPGVTIPVTPTTSGVTLPAPPSP